MHRLAWLVAVGITSPVWGQPPQVRGQDLAAPPVEVADGFTQITAIRVLKDGRVIVADARDRRLVLATFDSTEPVPLARTGQGPNEFLLPAALIALRGDTTWVLDPPNFRWLVLGPSGRPLSTVSGGGRDLAPSLRRGEILGTDRQGRFYVQVEERRGQGPASGASGVAHVMRLSRDAPREDTIVTLRMPSGRVRGTQPLAGGLVRDVDTHPLASLDVATVTVDGQVLVLRSPEYRVEWWNERGITRSGAAVPYSRHPVTPDEQRAYMEQQVRPGRVVLFGAGQQMRNAPNVSPERSGSLAAEIERATWPEHFPPFGPGVRVAPNGHIWVPLVRTSKDSTQRFDLLDPMGRRVRTIALPRRTRLLALGEPYVYLVRADEDDVEYLQRYRWP